MPFGSIWNDHKKWMVHLSQMGFEGFLPWDQACPCIRFGCHHGSVSTREHVFSFGHLLKVAWAKLLLSGPYLGRRPPRMRKGAVKFSKLVSLVRQGLLLVCWWKGDVKSLQLSFGEKIMCFRSFHQSTFGEVFFLDECKFLQQRSATTYYRLLLNS